MPTQVLIVQKGAAAVLYSHNSMRVRAILYRGGRKFLSQPIRSRKISGNTRISLDTGARYQTTTNSL